MKKLSKAVDIYGSYRKIKLEYHFFGPPGMFNTVTTILTRVTNLFIAFLLNVYYIFNFNLFRQQFV